MEVKKSMPNEKVLMEKQRIVEDLSRKLKSQAGVLVNYSGITVNEDTELRVRMREANVDYTVVKNTLMRFAIKNVGFEALEPILNGTTSLAVSDDDPVAPARIIKEYAEKLTDYFEIKGGFMDGRILSVSEVNALASIPPLPILQAQLLGTMLAPIVSLAVVLKAIAEKNDPLAAKPERHSGEEAPAEAVVEEPVVEEASEAAPEAPAEVVAEEPVVEEASEAAPEAPAEVVAEEPVVEEASEAAPEAPAEVVAKEPVVEEASEAAPEAPAEVVAEEPVVEEVSEAAPEAPAEVTAPAEAADESPAEAPVKKTSAKKPAAKPAPEEKAAGTSEKTPVKRTAQKKTAVVTTPDTSADEKASEAPVEEIAPKAAKKPASKKNVEPPASENPE